MTSDQRAALKRVRRFLKNRAAHRARLDAIQPDRNPMPNLIIAEYGTLDCDDLVMVCDALAAGA